MKDAVTDPMVLTLTGLGISFAPHQYYGGLFLALAAAVVAAKINPGKDRREWWVTLLTAAVFATFTAELISAYRPDLAPQFPMLMAGFLSRIFASGLLAAAQRIERRASDVADRMIDRVLPPEKDQDK
jgi:hypothetical protein